MKRIVSIFLIFINSGCNPLSIVDEPARYQDERIKYLILHFTSEHFERSMELLTGSGESRVSVHYLIPEPEDDTYEESSLRIYRLVPEHQRAWHAGVSYWSGTTSLNGTSVGIEIVNRSECKSDRLVEGILTPEEQSCTFYDYPEEQINLVIRLATDILERNPGIDPVNVIGHGDIAATRRVDPGPTFPWKELYENGIGAWYEEERMQHYAEQFEKISPTLHMLQHALNAYGYEIDVTGENDPQTRFAVRAFQMHFRPADYSGNIDTQTAAILFSLLERYRPEKLRQLQRLALSFAQ
ncbi:MAG: N-acetylmuramoyl-L-alanine amidase [Woeseia sp.]|nr:N-acetylmuramoyl-L-alanine amidase [Woeseia sp.]|tara:strand:+ start:901 stop:1791 length:891 start_codon:yes stop_codon:yes gene_type:complete